MFSRIFLGILYI